MLKKLLEINRNKDYHFSRLWADHLLVRTGFGRMEPHTPPPFFQIKKPLKRGSFNSIISACLSIFLEKNPLPAIHRLWHPTPGTLRHVMIRGINKRRIVNDVVDRKNFVKHLGTLSAETKTRIYAWALMTNHAHILLPSAEIGLSGFMRHLLTGYAIS